MTKFFVGLLFAAIFGGMALVANSQVSLPVTPLTVTVVMGIVGYMIAPKDR